MGFGRPRATHGAGAMSLLRREPREVYRVYDEGEFLAGADHAGTHRDGTEGEESPPLRPDELPHERVSTASSGEGAGVRRFAGPAMLVGAVAAVGGLVVASGLPSGGGLGRRPAGGPGAAGAAVSAVRSPRAQMAGGRSSAAASFRTGQYVARHKASAARALARRAARRLARHAAVAPDEAALGDAARLTASSPSGGPKAMRGEFGFEH
jgi:hypothetical protein